MEPRYNADLGIYEWGDPQPEPAPIEPAFVKEAIERDFEPTPIYSGVTTFGQVYPSGTKGSISTAEPVTEEFDALADWRVPGEVADEVLISLPEGTPRMLRTMLTLLLGAMRSGRPGHSKPS